MAFSTHSPPLSRTSDATEDSAPALAVPADEPLAALDVDTPASAIETPHGRSRRPALRARLYGYALVAVVLAAAVLSLAASNTAKTKVSWILGSSHVSLV